MPEFKRTTDLNFKLDYSDMISPIEEIRKQVMAHIAADKEGKFRQVLIDLGWTPPPDVREAQSQKTPSKP